MSLQSLVRLITIQPLQLFFAIISGIFQFLFSLTFSRTRPKIRSSSQSRQMKTEIELNGQNLYDEYTITVEQCLSLTIQAHNNYTNGGTFNSTRTWIDGKKWEFTVCRNTNSQHSLKLALALVEMDLLQQPNGQIAEILFWQWHRGKQIYILQRMVKYFQQPGNSVQFQFSTTTASAFPSDGYFNVLIRLLEKREKAKNQWPSFDDSENVTFLVGPETFRVSQHFLMAVSSVFQKMFSIEMREKASKEVNLEETNPDEFKAFLEAISPKQMLPNPYNVLELLKLADRFQVEQLRNRCEEHLVHCVEKSLIERLLCAEFYRLEKLKNYILKSLVGTGLRDFYEENQAELNLLSKDLLVQLTSRICTSVKIERAALCQNCQRNVLLN